MLAVPEQNEQKGMGNTIPSPKRHRRWTFTINNYQLGCRDELEQKFKGLDYVMGHEIGANGTPHIQGWVGFKNVKSFQQVKDIVGGGAHIEPARGTTAINYKYCSKDGDFVSSMEDPDLARRIKQRILKRYGTTVWKPWQKKVINITKGEPDGRTIHWLWEPTGNVGKSYLTKYLACLPGTIMGNGKTSDVFNSINKLITEDKIEPKVIVLDIPREAVGYVQFAALEKLVDGCFASGKYEGAQVVMEPVHMICFANTPPKLGAVSADRWNIIDLREPEPIPDIELEEMLYGESKYDSAWDESGGLEADCSHLYGE